MKQITALSIGFPGVSRVLEEGEKLGLWTFVPLETRKQVPEADVYLLGAWHPSYETIVSTLTERAKMGVLWTSSVGEMGFTPVELGYLKQLAADPRVSFFWCGNKTLAATLPKAFWAPYPLDTTSFQRPTVEKTEQIALFCPDTAKKNILNQLYAVLLVYKERGLTLATNIPWAREFGNWIGLPVDVVPWIPRLEYECLLASCRVNLACSWAETNSYQALEAILLGTPAVLSNAVPWAPEAWCASTPNDPQSIAGQVFRVLDDPESARHQREYICAVAESWNNTLRATLETKL